MTLDRRPLHHRPRLRGALVGLVAGLAVWLAEGAANAQPTVRVPPSPFDILSTDHLDTPVIDVAPVCIPSDLSEQMVPIAEMAENGEMREAFRLLEQARDRAGEAPLEAEILLATFEARLARKRPARLRALERLGTTRLRRASEAGRACVALERARLYLLIGRYPEAVAQAARIERLIPALGDAEAFIDAAAFIRAEVLYRRGESFEAHLAFRELAQTSDPRIAAAARLRLTDLSFDGGRSDVVRIEYEALLPKAELFGASLDGWALRAMEASLAIGDWTGAQAWLDRYLDTVTSKSLHDVVTIRQADLEVLRGEARAARSRLAVLAGRSVWSPVSELAKVRMIEWGLADGSDEKWQASLRWAIRSPDRGVAIYALGVMTHKSVVENDLDEGLAAATRLAYEHERRELTPFFEKDLEQLLMRAHWEVVSAASDEGCRTYVRRIGGRYGILIQQTEQDDVFFELGRCFDRLRMPQLSVELYRSMTRTYGNRAAERVALPLARASLAAGDHAMARAAARASLRFEGPDHDGWRLVLAEAELIEGHEEPARDLLRQALQGALPPADRVHALYLFATTLRGGGGRAGDLERLERAIDATRPNARLLPHGEFGRGAAIAAERRRGGADTPRASALYGTASEYLPLGSRRAESIYWQGSLAPARAQAERYFGQAAASENGGPWSSLASFELSFSELRGRYGRGR